MRKLIYSALMLATALPSAAMAQSAAELRHDQREIRESRQDLRQSQRHGSPGDVRDARDELRDDRQEYREDWRDYRNSNRNVYARGHWHAPFRYQNFREGVVIRPGYYSQRYWIAEPARYHLPPANGALRWVRHYDDALLVNVRNGRVVRVIRNFYW
jgi:Ni/Co efflux regulator RcnB